MERDSGEEMNCPNCETKLGKHVEAETGEIHIPKEDDIGLCFACGQGLQYRDGDFTVLDKTWLSWYQRLMFDYEHDKWSRSRQGIHAS